MAAMGGKGGVAGLCLLLPFLVTACEFSSPVQQQTEALTQTADGLKRHQQQMRRFDTRDEAALLAATAGVMQDLGFQIDEAAPGSGLVVGSKNRDAMEAGQVAASIFLSALAKALGARGADPIFDQTQRIRISVVTRSSADHAALLVQATIQRLVWNNAGRIAHVDTIDEPVIYQQFFDKLSQAAFLEAHEI